MSSVIEDRWDRGDGSSLAVSEHRPDERSDTAVVIAPGRGYHRGLPLLRNTAERLAASGVTAVRFDWSFTERDGEPSADGAAELADLGAVLAHLRERAWVRRVVLLGKSLGSRVAVAHAASDLDIAGIGILTPPVLGPQRHVPWPGLDAVIARRVPTLVLVGDRDPWCPLSELGAFVGRWPDPAPPVVVLPGDHGLAWEGGLSVGLATEAIVAWVRSL